MITIQAERTSSRGAPLAFRIRALRQWHGVAELSQLQLADLAGVSAKTVRGYERCRALPGTVRSLIAIARALQVPVEQLIDQHLLERFVADIEQRRTLPPGSTPPGALPGPLVLACCYRSPYLALAIVQGHDIVRVSCHSLNRSGRSKRALRNLIAACAADYAVTTVVVEPRYLSLLTTAAGHTGLSIPQAKSLLLPEAGDVSHRRLCAHLLHTYPQLRRLIRFTAETKEIITSDRWRTVQLLAVALGLAAVQQPPPATEPRRKRLPHYS